MGKYRLLTTTFCCPGRGIVTANFCSTLDDQAVGWIAENASVVGYIDDDTSTSCNPQNWVVMMNCPTLRDLRGFIVRQEFGFVDTRRPSPATPGPSPASPPRVVRH